MPATAKKKIFISDIHMGDARSMGQTTPYPYVWFQKNIPFLVNFLNKQLESTEVAEVIILGDLFDRWIIPTIAAPLTDFQTIVANPANERVITALQHLAAAGKLAYVPGNHDMLFSVTEQDSIQQYMQKKFPGIKYPGSIVSSNISGDDSDPTHTHWFYTNGTNGTIVGEHGNYYTIFNSPAARMDLPRVLPLGYFISRLQGYKLAQVGKAEDYFHILRKYILEKIGDLETFIPAFFDAWAHDAGLHKSSPIQMDGISGFPATVGEIGEHYENLVRQWPENLIDWPYAVAGEVQHLLLAAAVVYFAPGLSDKNIVIFGHTHRAEMWKSYELPARGLYNILGRLIQQIDKFWNKIFGALSIPKLQIPNILKVAPMVKHFHLNLPCHSIYVNCGSWVDSEPYCTYVETQEDFERGRHYVRLWAHPSYKHKHIKEKVLQEEYVNLKQ